MSHRGGGGDREVSGASWVSQHSKQEVPVLKLVNSPSSLATKNACFINSIIQLFKISGFYEFLGSQACSLLLASSKPDEFQLSKLLVNIYFMPQKEHCSVAPIREHVSLFSGKSEFKNGLQQDACQFLLCLEDLVSQELTTKGTFDSVRADHWGREAVQLSFKDTADGTCFNCHKLPQTSEVPFFFLKVTVPVSSEPVDLETLICGHRDVELRCSMCCPEKKTLPKEKYEDHQSATAQDIIVESPKYLYVQLLRFSIAQTGIKVNTMVTVQPLLRLPNLDRYQPIGFLDHQGSSLNSGHYVANIKNNDGNWTLLDDTFSSQSSLERANSNNNYLVVFKKLVAGESFSTPFKVPLLDIKKKINQPPVNKRAQSLDVKSQAQERFNTSNLKRTPSVDSTGEIDDVDCQILALENIPTRTVKQNEELKRLKEKRKKRRQREKKKMH